MRIVASIIAIAVLGCSTSYVPRTRGRVAVVIQDGMFAYSRDGETYRHGFLGSGLQRAVVGNPAAEQAANEYHSRQRDGLLITLGGLVCSTVALGAAIREIDRSNNDHVPTSLWISLGCLLVGLTVGPIYVASAEPYRWDAINMFNDAPAMPYGPPTGSTAPRRKTLSLRIGD